MYIYIFNQQLIVFFALEWHPIYIWIIIFNIPQILFLKLVDNKSNKQVTLLDM